MTKYVQSNVRKFYVTLQSVVETTVQGLIVGWQTSKHKRNGFSVWEEASKKIIVKLTFLSKGMV